MVVKATTIGGVLLLSLLAAGPLLAQEDQLFVSYEEIHGEEIWVSDKPTSTPYILKDLLPKEISESIQFLTPSGKNCLFSAQDPTNGVELWITNGTLPGTKVLKDIAPGKAGSHPSDLTVVGDLVYFVAQQPASGRELWVTDGTTDGTQMVKDLVDGAESSNPTELTSYRNKIFFVSDHAKYGREIWSSDGTEIGTHLIKDIHSDLSADAPHELLSTPQGLYFVAGSEEAGEEVWIIKGINNRASMIKDIASGTQSSYPTNLVYGNGQVFFTTSSANKSQQIWKSDGTDAGTSVVHSSEGSSINQLRYCRNHLFYISQTGAEAKAIHYVSDNGTKGVLSRNGTPISKPSQLLVVEDKLIFESYSEDGKSLCASTGPYGSTEYLMSLENENGKSFFNPLSIQGETLFFQVKNANKTAYWLTSGKVESTQEIDMSGSSATAVNIIR